MNRLASPLRQYLVVTGNYWAFTLSDGALRMLVVLYFDQIGYSPLAIAMLFLFYEFFGVVTNLCGGWLGARIGLNRTMQIGLLLQIGALGMLLAPTIALTVPWVMAAQALSGIAKDLNKMSAKSAIKQLVPTQGTLYRWVALLTGSKNTLKGVGFFLGALLLSLVGFKGAALVMLIALTAVALFSLLALNRDLGRARNKPRFTDMFSGSTAVNTLAAARLCLFAARDIWFVVALPVFLADQMGWDSWEVGAYLACWVIGYGLVQAATPRLLQRNIPNGRHAALWAILLAAVPAALSWWLHGNSGATVLTTGLIVFGIAFAINSAIHSFLIVDFARVDGVSMDVGFYYAANALGRLLGTVLSGWLYQQYGLATCMLGSALLTITAGAVSLRLPGNTATRA